MLINNEAKLCVYIVCILGYIVDIVLLIDIEQTSYLHRIFIIVFEVYVKEIFAMYM